ncbi:hypothetical protein Anas_12739 [Armadillidium nasatum]|uniref:Uncharacterized protein n=1 Tax=Armadillidium nasatum TaxID=96803 RepID=A0A5N5T369_9CRUS|nr:hypothetical protein Anas_12739 [Armadillidium nasatum]
MKCLVLCLLLVTLAYSLPTTILGTAPVATGTGNTRATDLLTEYLNFRTSQGRPFYYGDFDDDDFYKYLYFNKLSTGANTGIRTAGPIVYLHLFIFIAEF